MKDQKPRMHTGSQRHLLRLARSQEALGEGAEYRVVPDGCEGTHVECGPHLGAPAPDGATASQGSVIPIERSHSDEGRDLLPMQGPQLRQAGQEGPTPGCAVRLSFSRQMGLRRMPVPSSSSSRPRRFSSQARCA